MRDSKTTKTQTNTTNTNNTEAIFFRKKAVVDEVAPKKEKKNKKSATKVDDEMDDAPNSNELSDKTKDEMKRQFEKLKEEYPEFNALKGDIVDAMTKIDPILDKAEAFMNKYSKYKSQKK